METDAEFVEMTENTIWGSIPVSCRGRLFALARRGAEAADRIEQLEAEVRTWQGHAKTAIWSDSEECKFLTARIEQLEAALDAIGRMQLVSSDYENTCTLAKAIRLAADTIVARAALGEERT